MRNSDGAMVLKGSNEPHPNASYIMYNDLIKNAVEKYNMEMLFTDFLSFRQGGMERYECVPDIDDSSTSFCVDSRTLMGDRRPPSNPF